MLVLTPRGPYPGYNDDEVAIARCVRVLLEYGAVPSMWHIRRALWNGWMSALRELVTSSNLSIRPMEFTPVMETCLQANPVALKILLDAGCDPNTSCNRSHAEARAWPSLPLHIAIVACSFTNVRLLLDYGANPYEVDGVGRTALDCMSTTEGHRTTYEWTLRSPGFVFTDQGQAS